MDTRSEDGAEKSGEQTGQQQPWDKALVAALLNANLDIEYWATVLEENFNITKYEEISNSINILYRELKTFVRNKSEANSLEQILALWYSYEEFQSERREETIKQEDECRKLVDKLDQLIKEGKDQSCPIVTEYENKLRLVLEVPEKIWEYISNKSSLGEIVDGLKGQLGKLCVDDTELSAKDLLRNASDGLVFRGILITNDPTECSVVRQQVLQVPDTVTLKIPSAKERFGEIQFKAEEDFDMFNVSNPVLGLQEATNVKDGMFSFQKQSGFSSAEAKNQYGSPNLTNGIWIAKYHIVPTASVKLHPSDLVLGEEIRADLKDLEVSLLEKRPSEHILKKCKDILVTYGSHVSVGDFEIGGTYVWEAGCQDQKREESTFDIVEKGVSGLISESYSGVFSSEGQIRQDIADVLDIAPNNDVLSRLSLKSLKIGGPQVNVCFPLWKMRLFKQNSSWAVVNRTCSMKSDVVGIWEIVRNSTLEFVDPGEVSYWIEYAWHLRSLIGPDFFMVEQNMAEAQEKLNGLLETAMQDWIIDVNFTQNAAACLHKLMNIVDACCLTEDGIAFWEEKLLTDQMLIGFLNKVIETKTKYSREDLYSISSHLSGLLSTLEGKPFPLEHEMHQFLMKDDKEEHVLEIVDINMINTIPSLIKAIEENLLPAMDTNSYGKNPKRKTRKRTALLMTKQQYIEKKVTKELTAAVRHVLPQLEQSDKHELFLIKVVLQKFPYNFDKMCFDGTFSEQDLFEFSLNLKSIWEEFIRYVGIGVLETQAFLVHTLIMSLPENCMDRKENFESFLHDIAAELHTDIAIVLAKFASIVPFYWDSLRDTLQELTKGNRSCLQREAVDIRGLRDIAETLKNEGLCASEDEDILPIPKQNIESEKILIKLGLTRFYPSKISLQKVMAIGAVTEDDQTSESLPWRILQKLIMLDYNSRDNEASNTADDHITETADQAFDMFLEDFENDGQDEQSLNPLDVILAIYSCCDMTLKQVVAQKLFTCRLAVPFIWQELSGDSMNFSVWALRSIIVEWKNKEQVCMETSIVSQPVKMVSFIRAGKPSCSKSILLNNILSDQYHHTFWNRECPFGNTEYLLANGLVEAQWYLPSGKPTDLFEDVTMFTDLRGDATEQTDGLEFLRKTSNVIVCCLEMTDLGNPDIVEAMKSIHCSSAKVILLLVTKDPAALNRQTLRKLSDQYMEQIGKDNMTNTKIVSGTRGSKTRTIEDLKQELRSILRKLLSEEETKSLEDLVVHASLASLTVDEDDELCQKGKGYAKDVITCMDRKPIHTCKREFLPLQQEGWQEWSKIQKCQQKSGIKESVNDNIYSKAQAQTDMTQLRKDQLKTCDNLSDLMKNFVTNILRVIDSPKETAMYMRWLKILFDEQSRGTLPGLHKEYHKKWIDFYATMDDPLQGAQLKSELEKAERMIAEASFGVEHLLREIAQVYEAALESKVELAKSTREIVDQLPRIASRLLLRGHAIEIMDGDTANVPLTWVKAVFSSMAELVGDKKLFIISVLGIQSSGKSTLLNTMFGLEFAVSAGRCTRGVFMQLIKVEGNRLDLPYDYVLVIDTEGLRAPELAQQKHDNDNQLATFVIGLGDVTILNIKGENVAEVTDVLQIAVHAFLRMKIVSKSFQMHRSSVFIHQNVPAINAKEKMQHGGQKLKEKLDQMTKEASAIENIVNINKFNDVIEFDGESDVWYFSDLWHGDPPMAPVNPGYSEKVRDVKACILNDLPQKQSSFLSFLDMKMRIEDLWKGVLSESFVFSFRNSLAAKAYNSMEAKYHETTWDVENNINNWVIQDAMVQLERCSNCDQLEVATVKVLQELRRTGSSLVQQACLELEDFFETHNLKDILIEWKASKVERLKNGISSVIERTERDLRQRIESLKIDLYQKTTNADIHVEIMKKAMKLAENLRGEEICNEQVRTKFEQFWTERREEYITKSNTEVVHIEDIVCFHIQKRFEKDSTALEHELPQLQKPLTVDKLEGSISTRDVGVSDISVQQSTLKWMKNKVLGRRPEEQCRERAVEIINHILRTVDIYLSDIRKIDTGFNEIYSQNVMNLVYSGIHKHNQQVKQNLFTFLPNLTVRIAVHACRHAVNVFQKIQKDFQAKHAIEKKLEEFKIVAWSLFKNTVNQCTIEMIAADLLLKHMEILMKDAVDKRMSGNIVNYTVRYFNQTKFHLIVKILEDLAEGPFENYKAYVQDTKAFGLEWLTTFMDKEIFTPSDAGLSKYAEFAQNHIYKLSEGIKDSLGETDQVVKKAKHQSTTIEKWVETFCEKVEGIPLKKDDLKPVLAQKVQNFEFLEKLVVKGLEELKQNVLATFALKRSEDIRWEGTTPYKQVIDRLWGCEAQCPLCSEVCQWTDPKHLESNRTHQCIQHRSSGIAGTRSVATNTLCISSCNFKVQSNGKLQFSGIPQCVENGSCARPRDGVYHPYKEYKKFLPDWDIAPSPDMESSKYWMWFMAKYKHKLAEWWLAKVPYIPESWNNISKQEAFDSLRIYCG